MTGPFLSDQDPANRGRGGWRWLLAALLVMALSLRVAGLGWGLPDEHHFMSYRADEWRAVRMALELDLLGGDFVPRYEGRPYFNWGSIHLYLVSLALEIARLGGALDFAPTFAEWSSEAFSRAHWIARLVSSVQNIAAVGLAFAVGSAALGRAGGLFAALLLALCPLDVIEAQSALGNASVSAWTFLGLAAIGFAVVRRRRRDHLLAGLAVGAAISGKLTALSLLPLLGLAVLWSALADPPLGEPGKPAPRLRRLGGLLLAAGGGALLGFALTSPAVLMHPTLFLEQAHRQLFYRPSVGAGMTFLDTGNGWIYFLAHSLPVSLGWPVYLLSLAGGGLAVRRVIGGLREGSWRRPGPELALCAFGLAWFLILFLPLGLSKTRFLRYLLPITPVACLFAAMAAQGLWRISGRQRPIARALVALALAHIALYSLAQVASLRRAEPRDLARAWFEQEVPAGASAALLKWPSQLLPPVHPWAGPPRARPRRAEAVMGFGERDIRWHILDLDPEELLRIQPDYVVLNSTEMAPFARHGTEEQRRLLELLERDYDDAAGPWSNDLRILGLDFTPSSRTPGFAPSVTEVRILRRVAPAEPGQG